MLDIRWIRDNPKEFDILLTKRGLSPMGKEIIRLDEERRQLVTLTQNLQHARKKKSAALGNFKNQTSNDFIELKRDVEHINDRLDELMQRLEASNELQNIMDNLPNLPESDVPYGTDESMNKLIKVQGEAARMLGTKQHFELGEKLGMMDFSQTALMSGSRFVTLKYDLALLERALANFMLDVHTKEFEFVEVSPPYLVRPAAMYNSGQLPKFADDSFETTDNYRLIPTAEVPLVNLVADRLIKREELPIRYVAHTPCFRSEAGSASKDTRGMIRLHQFSKVELVTITTPDESRNEHEYMLNAAEEILRKLGLPYRVMLLCSGDMGFQASKTYDIEVWMPGQGVYREISSCSNCGNFQARRMKARYKEFGSIETTYVHTLNGSALPIGRTMVAIMENYQNSDGSITVPDRLVSYMNGTETIYPVK